MSFLPRQWLGENGYFTSFWVLPFWHRASSARGRIILFAFWHCQGVSASYREARSWPDVSRATSLQEIRHVDGPEEVHFADIDAVVAEDGVGHREAEIGVRNN